MDKFFSCVIIVFKVLFLRLLLKNDQISYCLFDFTYELCQAFNIKNKHFQMWHTCTMVEMSNTKTTFLSWNRVNKIHFYIHMFSMQSLHISFLYLCESNNLYNWKLHMSPNIFEMQLNSIWIDVVTISEL